MSMREYRIAPHVGIICGEIPPYITTQSAELYRRLELPRVRRMLQEYRTRYPQSGYFAEPRRVR